MTEFTILKLLMMTNNKLGIKGNNFNGKYKNYQIEKVQNEIKDSVLVLNNILNKN